MVIQRWQSVLLLCAVVMMACFTFLSLGQVQMPDYTLNFTTIGFDIEGEATDGGPSGYLMYSWPLFCVSLLGTILPAIGIFCYKSLRLQKTLCLMELLVILTAIGVACIYGYTVLEPYSVSWSTLALAPVIAFIAVVMAYRCICSDDRKLKAADRLR